MFGNGNWFERVVNKFAPKPKAVSQSNPQKEVKKMAQVFDKRGKAHEAVNFVICVDEGNTHLLTQGKVYANLGSFGGVLDNLWVIDDRGLKQNFSKERFAIFTSERNVYGLANANKAYLTIGKLYQVSENRPGAKRNPGCVWALDNSNNWGSYGKSVFDTQVNITFSEQYMMAKMKSAYKGGQLQPGQYDATVQGVEVKDGALVLDFKVGDHRIQSATAIVQENAIRYVQVQFESGGKLYTYKHRGEVSIGDKAVVLVENKMYPELCGTKVVEVVNVLDHNPTGFDLKWLVSVVNLDVYRARQQAEEQLRQAEAALERKVQSMMKEDMLRILAERDPEAAALVNAIQQLKGLI